MASLHRKIMKAFREQWKDVTDALDDIPGTGRVMGVIISPAFDRYDHDRRQKMLDTVLKKSAYAC